MVRYHLARSLVSRFNRLSENPTTSSRDIGVGSRSRVSLARRSHYSPACEVLEARQLLTVVPGYDYVLSGEKWSNPSRITYSIPPDGIFWDHGINNLNSTFDAKFGAGVWERIFARALATWEAAANINIVPVADDGEDFNAVGQSQGDPRFGDIRMGGYNYNVSTVILAQTYFPPPNGTTAAGDFEANTSIDFNIGSQFDLYSVVLHEMGHALGLDHSHNPAEVMYPSYQGIRTGLSPGDIAGIQALYGARTLDTYQSVGLGTGFSSSIDLSTSLNTTADVTISGVSLASIGSSEFYSFTIPSRASNSLSVTAIASNVSLLSPKVSLYNASGTLIAQASNASSWSDNVTVTTSNIVPGQRYYVVVSGATGDVFDVGSYQLNVSLPGTSRPTTSTPSTPSTPSSPTNPQPITVIPPSDRFEPDNSLAQAVPLGKVTRVTIPGLTLNTAIDTDYFRFKSAGAGTYQIVASGLSLSLYDAKGRLIKSGTSELSFTTPKKIANYSIVAYSASQTLVSNYSLAITFAKPTKVAVARRMNLKVIAPKAVSKPSGIVLLKAAIVTDQIAVSTGPTTILTSGNEQPFRRSIPRFLKGQVGLLDRPRGWVADLGNRNRGV